VENAKLPVAFNLASFLAVPTEKGEEFTAFTINHGFNSNLQASKVGHKEYYGAKFLYASITSSNSNQTFYLIPEINV